MIKCIRPELNCEVSTSEEGSNGIREGLVSAFNRSILEGCLGASGSDFVSFGSKEISNSRIVIKLTTLIKMDVLVPASVPRGILGEEES